MPLSGYLLTTQRRAPPLHDDSCCSALARVGLQRVTKTVISIGTASTEVVNTSSVPLFRRHHGMTGLKDGRLQDFTASVGPLFGLVACILTRVNILARTTGGAEMGTICDLK